MTVSSKIICLLGNHGSGKSSVCNLINGENESIIGIDCNSELSIIHGIDFSFVDKLNLEYTFDSKCFDEIFLPNQTSNGKDIFWIILDCDVKIIIKRIEYRTKMDIWNTEKGLFYLQQRFRHMGAHFGIPFIDTTYLTLDEVHHYLIDIVNRYSKYYRYYRQCSTQTINNDFIQQHDIENRLRHLIKVHDVSTVSDLPEYADEIKEVDQEILYIRWFIRNHSIELDQEREQLHVGDYSLPIAGAIFKLMMEGESKKVYQDISGNPFTKNLAFIVLKSTIYSHSMQITGEIQNLGSIRACGSQIFLEMMWRNGLKHAYRSINSHGIIVSDFVNGISPLEIIVKRYCEGTDKKSFYHIQGNLNIVIPNTDGEYLSGPYVRFDRRNPNHISPFTGLAINHNPYYYIYERALGKENFFKRILNNKTYAVSIGDKNITEDLITNVLDVKKTKRMVLKMFMVIQSYFSRVNLLIKDVCFMLNDNGEQFWSEINQDCMRITSDYDNTNKFDKDIWRFGGLSSRTQILDKWQSFNQIFIDFFHSYRFHETELLNYNTYLYQHEIQQLLNKKNLKIPEHLQELWSDIRGKGVRQILVTMDMCDGQPVLVRSSKISEIHHDGDYWRAMDKINIFPNVLVVDLDGAFGQGKTKNRSIIKILGKKFHIDTGGGLRTLEDIEDVLKSGVRRCVVASANDELISKIPKDRLVVEISIDEENIVLIHGRQTNTHLHILTRINQLVQIGVQAISITFVQAEGHLAGIPRRQIQSLIVQIPLQIKKIYIAGGISTLDDLEFLWSFARVVPQLGSAIWKDKLSIGSIFNSMIHFDHQGLISAIIQDTHGSVKGLCYMNRQSIDKTCETRKLYRYSRQFNRVMMKGETSGQTQNILQINVDCDSDALLIIVDSKHPFCHSGEQTCFNTQTNIKGNFVVLADHIKMKFNSNSYSGQMQRFPSLALAKVMEEFWEMMVSDQDHQINECSDFLVHFIMYLNGIGVTMQDIFNELNARRLATNLLIDRTRILESQSNDIILGIAATKYTVKTDQFAQNELGIRIIRQSGRNLSAKSEIINRHKFFKYFGDDENIQLSLFPCKPKDMAWLLASKRITHAITFEAVIENYPAVYKCVYKKVDPTIGLALICRQGAQIEPDKWSKHNKTLIATEHIYHVTRFLEQCGIDSTTYHLDRVTGSSEAFLVNTNNYLLADAIVETCQTLKENDLEIWKMIIPRGFLHIALYKRCI